MNRLRFGGTSWVIPGSFAENLRVLAEDVGDMELVLFDTPQASNIPSAAEVRELASFCRELDMTCTVHFAQDICASASLADRTKTEDSALRLIDLFTPLYPFAWIVHFCGERRGPSPSADMERWLELTQRSAARLASAVGDSDKICAETLDYNFDLIYGIIKSAGLSVCLDVGHLVKYGCDVKAKIREYIADARVLHLHGVRPDGTDHVDLSHFDAGLFAFLMNSADDGRERVCTLEVFENDYEKSLPVLKKLLK